MADPVTILGATAAASQLAEQGLKITILLCQLGSQMRDARDSTNKRVEQIEQVISIARQITLNPSLQTENIASVLKTCLEETRNLDKILRKLVISSKHSRALRVVRSLRAVMKEREIDAHFDNLERIKGLLSLCISERIATNMQTTSQDIHSSVKGLHPILSNTSTDMSTVVNSLPAILEQLVVMDHELRKFRMEGNSCLESTSKMHLESVLQHVTLNHQSPRLCSHFSSKMFTHYHIPVARKKTFVSFDDTLSRLQQSFSVSPKPCKSVVNLAGVACGGKSQVALEFCHRARLSEQFGAIFLIKASSTTLIEKAFQAIADKFNIPKSDPPEERLKTLMAILSAWPCPWLLVFDNYSEEDLARLEPYMPDGQQASFLITRKAEKMKQGGSDKTIYLPDLRLQDAVEMLLTRSAVAQTDENYEQGVKLAVALEKIPRAIMQAGTYIKKHKLTIAAYLRLFQDGDSRTAARLLHDIRTRRSDET